MNGMHGPDGKRYRLQASLFLLLQFTAAHEYMMYL